MLSEPNILILIADTVLVFKKNLDWLYFALFTEK